VKILNTKFQHTSTIEMYCVENQHCVVLGARAHGFQDPKHRINYAQLKLHFHLLNPGVICTSTYELSCLHRPVFENPADFRSPEVDGGNLWFSIGAKQHGNHDTSSEHGDRWCTRFVSNTNETLLTCSGTCHLGPVVQKKCCHYLGVSLSWR
jgi:hypothetical protein